MESIVIFLCNDFFIPNTIIEEFAKVTLFESALTMIEVIRSGPRKKIK